MFPQIEVALELNTAGAKEWLKQLFTKPETISGQPAAKNVELAVMLIEKNKEEHIPLVENIIAVLDQNNKKALVNEILDAKATNYYRLVAPLVIAINDEEFTEATMGRIIKNSLKQLYSPIMEVSLNQNVSFVTDEDRLSTMIKEAIERKQPSELIGKGLRKLRSHTSGGYLKYPLIEILKKKASMYYPLVVEQYGRLTLLDKKEVIPLIISDGITELFDVVEKDLIKAKAQYSWESWPEIELGKLQQKKAQLKK